MNLEACGISTLLVLPTGLLDTARDTVRSNGIGEDMLVAFPETLYGKSPAAIRALVSGQTDRIRSAAMSTE
jgi:hypothetical protein